MKLVTAALAALFCISCSSSAGPHKKVPVEISVTVHDKAAWYAYRGSAWGLSPAQAAERDADFDAENPPPPDFWDAQVAVESATIWRVMCNECHKGQRRISSAADIPPPEEGWGVGKSRFFKRKRAYSDMHRQIAIGGASKPAINSQMPGFADELSNEQMWGLVYFIEQAGRDGPAN